MINIQINIIHNKKETAQRDNLHNESKFSFPDCNLFKLRKLFCSEATVICW